MPFPLNSYIDVDSQHGFVVFHDAMQRDPSDKVAQAARVSYGNEDSEKPTQSLIAKLADEQHTSPFRHSPITLIVQCPEFVARQWYKHIVGAEYTFKDSGWNEISGRYIQYDKYYIPPMLYRKAHISKMGSSSEIHERSDEWLISMSKAMRESMNIYNAMINDGVSKEQARTILPMNLYTRFMWTASQQTLFHFCKLRTAPDAQREIREYAVAINYICTEHYGISWQALTDSAKKGKA
jgi:thymidylate synthase (FAD)